MRIFYALPLPQESAEALFNASLSLRGRLLGGSVTPKENLHVTVSFVGNVNEIKTDILAEILREAASRNRPPELQFCEPTMLRGADLICSKIKPNEELFKINRDLVMLLGQKGFTVEKRFTPHVTLIRRPVFRIPFAQLKSEADFCVPPFFADGIALMESRMRDGAPPRYLPVEIQKFKNK